MNTNKDTLDVTREILVTQYLDALKNGEEEKRLEAIEKIKELNQQKMAKLIEQAQL